MNLLGLASSHRLIQNSYRQAYHTEAPAVCATIKSWRLLIRIALAELRPMAERMYGTMVKADVDVAKKIVVIDMDMHADGEAYLLERGSR